MSGFHENKQKQKKKGGNKGKKEGGDGGRRTPLEGFPAREKNF